MVYTFLAGTTHSRTENSPGNLNWKLHQLGIDLVDYYTHYKIFPQDLEEIRTNFERTDYDYWDVYSKNSNEPFGYEIIVDGTSETCNLYTTRLEEAIGIVEVVSGTAEFKTTDAYKDLWRDYLANETKGIAVWSGASMGEKCFHYLFLPHRLLEHWFRDDS